MNVSAVNWSYFLQDGNFWQSKQTETSRKYLMESKEYELKNIYDHIESNKLYYTCEFPGNMCRVIEKRINNKKEQLE
ncbi:hypothetical protein Catovirus_2_107 [Catovirus CTV1]|uniref:Uncharacterized protein n=1 Tax=Catovirus CTV1 TaxID=1977631 RepID=A0A1V0SBY1_9VIRU|nr:hypothetical protein Catovirus_2_107 [Catovirus CTV1]